MVDGRPALAPLPFLQYCNDYPGACKGRGGSAIVRLDGQRLAELDAINRRVNRRIRPRIDSSLRRHWRLDVREGDCNAFAIQKQHDLLAAGWPPAALALAVVRTPGGEGHLVLTIRTDRGDLVLDNLRERILNWDRTGYRWIKRQSAENLRRWVSIEYPVRDGSVEVRTVGLAASMR